MKWHHHLLLYLLSCVVAELLLVAFFAIGATANKDASVWADFWIPQTALPVSGTFVWLMLEAVIQIEDGTQKEAEWRNKVNEMLKERERENGRDADD